MSGSYRVFDVFLILVFCSSIFLFCAGCRSDEEMGRYWTAKKAPDLSASTANLEKANVYFRKVLAGDTNNLLILDRIVRNDLKIGQNRQMSGMKEFDGDIVSPANRGISRLIARRAVDYDLVSSVLALSAPEPGLLDETIRSLTAAASANLAQGGIDGRLISAEIYFLIGRQCQKTRGRDEARKYLDLAVSLNNRIIDELEQGNEKYGALLVMAKVSAEIAYNYRLRDDYVNEISFLNNSVVYGQKSVALEQNVSESLLCLVDDYRNLSAAYVRINKPQKAAEAGGLSRKYADLAESREGKQALPSTGPSYPAFSGLTQEERIGLSDAVFKFLPGKKFKVAGVEILNNPVGKTFYVRYRIADNGRWSEIKTARFAYSVMDGEWLTLPQSA